MLVLRGATEVLRSAKPALFVELHEEGLNKFGSSISDMLGYLSGFGYTPNWLDRDGSHRGTSLAEIQAVVARIGYVDVLFLGDAGRNSSLQNVGSDP